MKRAFSILIVLSAVACGSSPPPKVEAPKTEETSSASSGPTPMVSQELGSIDERAVQQTFAKLETPLEKCHQDGRARLEYLSGDVKVFMRVGQDGKVRYAYFEESSLGDRDTEKCILDVLMRTDWPKPQGGEAEVRNGFGWPAGSERAPTPWGPEKAMTALDEAKDVKKDVQKCKAGVKGDFVVTGYVEHDDAPPPAKHDKAAKAHNKKHPKHDEKPMTGHFKALGIVPPTKDGADKIDCLVDALKPLRMPEPGSYAAKLSFPL